MAYGLYNSLPFLTTTFPPRRQHGPVGFYKGLSPNLMRVVPATALTFLVYEKTSHFLLQLRSDDSSPAPQDQSATPDQSKKADE